MLIEDVGNGYMTRGFGVDPGPTAVPHCRFDSSVDLDRVFRRALGGSNYRRGLTESVFEFIRETAVTMLRSGEAVYEIVYLPLDIRDDGLHFEFARINPGTYKLQRRSLRQDIPLQLQGIWQVPPVISVPLSQIVRFRFPSEFASEYRVLVQSLSIAASTMPDFAFELMRQRRALGLFDLSAFQAQSELVLTAGTSRVGWTARGLLAPRMLEYYYLFRMLRFVEFRFWLRDQILATLNEALDRVGHELGISGSIKLTGVRTVSDVRAAVEAMSRRERDFRQILQVFEW